MKVQFILKLLSIFLKNSLQPCEEVKPQENSPSISILILVENIWKLKASRELKALLLQFRLMHSKKMYSRYPSR